MSFDTQVAIYTVHTTRVRILQKRKNHFSKSHVSVQRQHHKIWHVLSFWCSQPAQMLASNLNNVHLVSGHKIQTRTIEHSGQC